ncbi:hypothetical protein [Embleya sp. NPDC059237]|uniref:hypothetical protein n=1 Tax=Embleya sp. NPDC059237 TaxID=3346784 RepID=UPI0036CDC091
MDGKVPGSAGFVEFVEFVEFVGNGSVYYAYDPLAPSTHGRRPASLPFEAPGDYRRLIHQCPFSIEHDNA